MAIANIRVVDEVWCHISGLSIEHNELLWNRFGPFVDGYKYMPKFQLGRWDGRVRFFEKTGKTYYNLLSLIIPIIEDELKYEITIEDERDYYPSPLPITASVFGSDNPIQLRPHQVIGVNKLLAACGGFGIFPTGTGKSLMTAALSKVFNDMDYRVLTIVPSTDLVNQTYDWYQICGIDTGRYCGDFKDLNHYSIVATWQSLQNNARIIKDLDIKVIIWDESHGAKASVAQKLLNEYGNNSPFKFGVTGTFPKSYTDQLSLKAAIGDIEVSMTARWLMDNGYLTPVEIETFKIKERAKENFPNYDAEKAYLTKNTDRLNLLADLIIAKCDEFGNTLVLVPSVSMGKKLANEITGAIFLSGETKNTDRKEQYDMFETEDNIIVIATYGIASTGISIDRVFHLMMVDSGKSYIRAIQTIGRSLRQAEGKNVAHVSDVYSDLKWSKKHFNERKKYYKELEYPVVRNFDIKS
jgi:superfamily II DNA or RNA helicase